MAVSFDFISRLGSGYFGEVWLATDTGLGCEVALKCIPPEKLINRKNFYQEAQVLTTVQHANIVRVYDTGTLDDDRVYVSMEYLPKGSLEDEAKGAYIGLSRAKRLMIDILRALGYAHEKGIIHRDIKPANILIGNSQEGILSDFGLALPNVQQLDIAYLKKYQYILHLAPEVHRIQDYGPLSDIYACGATLYRLVNGDNYLPQVTLLEAQSLAQEGKFPTRDKYRDFVPSSLRRIINKALNTNPQDRYQSADEMRRALEQQKFNVDWQERVLRGGIIWNGVDKKGVLLQVKKLEQAPDRWSVETRRGSNQQNLRRVSALCFYDLSKVDAARQTRRVLQDFVTGRHRS
jgi:eukaryotic-like serine/threonine-protein kinase